MVLSECTTRKDRKGFDKKIIELNEEIHNFGIENNLYVIKHDAINDYHLAKKKMHLSSKGKNVLELAFKQLKNKELLKDIMVRNKINININNL